MKLFNAYKKILKDVGFFCQKLSKKTFLYKNNLNLLKYLNIKLY